LTVRVQTLLTGTTRSCHCHQRGCYQWWWCWQRCHIWYTHSKV